MEQLTQELLIQMTTEVLGPDWFVSPRTHIEKVSEESERCELYLVKLIDSIKEDEAHLRFTIDQQEGISIRNQVRYALAGLRDARRAS